MPAPPPDDRRLTPPGARLYAKIPDRVPGGFDGQLITFAEELRSEQVAIGTSELLDAFDALTHISWTSQPDFKGALAATLTSRRSEVAPSLVASLLSPGVTAPRGSLAGGLRGRRVVDDALTP